MGIVLPGLPPFCMLGGFLVLAWRRNRAYVPAPADETPAATGYES
jgi:hypothetical protein